MVGIAYYTFIFLIPTSGFLGILALKILNMNNYNTPLDSDNQPQRPIPNAGGILALGILSIIFAGLIGLILGIIALSLSSRAKAEYEMNPGAYTPGSMSNVNGGRICAIIGISLTALVLLIVLGSLAAR